MVSIVMLWMHECVKCLTAIGLTLGGSSPVHIYTQTAHRTTQTEHTERNIHNNKNTYANIRTQNIT
jgi:hypothetical protein